MFGVTGLQFKWLKESYEGSPRRWAFEISYLCWLSCWLVGHLVGGMVFFGLLGWFGSWLPVSAKFPALIGLAILCLACALHQFRVINLPLPQIVRQVSRAWVNNLDKNFVAFGYGFQLGTGVMTRIKITTTYIVILCAFSTGSMLYGAIIGALFGLSRAVLPVYYASRNTNPNQALSFALKFNSKDDGIKRINGIALLSTGVLIGLSIFFHWL